MRTQSGCTTLHHRVSCSSSTKAGGFGNVRSPNLGCLVPQAQLLAQPLVECECARLGTAVLHHVSETNETSHGGDRDYMAMVLCDHAWQELAHHQEMRDGINLEGLPDLGLWLLKDCAVVANARIVDENRGVALGCSDLFCDFSDTGGGGDVGFVESDTQSWST